MNARDRARLEALERIIRYSERMPSPWVGTRETGVMPNTADALVERGWILIRHDAGRRRLVYKPTQAGRDALAASKEA